MRQSPRPCAIEPSLSVLDFPDVPRGLRTFSCRPFMKIDSRFDPFLRGSAFDNELGFPTSQQRGNPGVLPDRISHLVELCRGKRVLHLGCCDHPPLVHDKLKNGTWLHARLTEVSQVCLGVDIDSGAVEFVKRETGFENVLLADLAVTAPEPVRTDPPWDLLVAGEIVEHLDSPVDFLSRLNQNLLNHCREIVVSVPNAFSLQNFLGARRHLECINSDHRYWFTPYTLAKVLTRSGFRPTNFDFVSHGRIQAGGIRSWLRVQMLRRYPGLRPTLVMNAVWP